MRTTDLPWVLSYPILTHALSLAAVAVASRDSLRLWRAVSALPRQDAASFPNLTSPPPSPSPSAFHQWRGQPLRTKAKRVFAVVCRLAFFLGLEFAVIFLLPKINSQMVKDGLFAALWVFVFIIPVTGILSLVRPAPSQVRYERKKPDDPLRLVISNVDDTDHGFWSNVVEKGLPIAGSIGVIALVAYDFTAHLPVIGAVFIWTSAGSFRLIRMRMRSIILFIMGVLVLASIIVVGIFAVMWSHDEPNKKPPIDDPGLSDWVINVSALFMSVMPMAFPSVMITMTYRFEYSQFASQFAVAEEENEKDDASSEATIAAPVRIPTDWPSFPCPITTASLLSLLLCLAVLDTVLGKNVKTISPFPMLATIPAVPVFTALAAAQQGKLGEWWHYEEIWVPQ
ncbi:hypothetical protein IAR50_007403 [Cryptococcus sp. DSM 104548]